MPLNILLLTSTLWAQPTDVPSAPRDLEEVTVTGTRLVKDPMDGAYPISVVDRADLEKSGFATVGDYLQQLPFMTGSPLGTSVSARGQGGGLSRGIASVELRGLGPERTLVLVNGQRFVPGGTGGSGIVDVGMIPNAMIERIEILKTGDSVIYGADAVAGVVNIITRKPFDGITASARAGVTGEGDGDNYRASVVWGHQSDRLGIVVGLEVFDQQSVSKGDRAFSSRLLTVSGPDNHIVADGSSAPPQGNYRTSDGRVTLIDGASGDSPSDYRPFIGSGANNDRYNFNPFEDLQQDSQRQTLFVTGNYRLSDALGAHFEASAHRRKSDQQLAPLPFFTTRETDVVVDENNVYNPFGETIVDARRRLIEAGPRTFRQDNETWRVKLGLDGAAGRWAWDANVVRARNTTDQQQTGDLLDSRLQLALGPSYFDADGTARCGVPGNPVTECVPLDLFGENSITPEMLRYVGADLFDTGYNNQTLFNANIAGDLFTLGTGPVASAFGYEYRKESAADIPDPQTVAGNTSGAARSVTRGEFHSNEVYAELGIPLVDAPFTLDLDVGARLIRFSNFDQRTVWESGLIFQPIDGLTFRAAWSEAFRAPTVGELFGGFAQSNPAIEDPCADFSSLTQTAIDRCIAQGVPADGSFDQTGNETPLLGGGNPNLDAESAEVVTMGVTWRPAAIPDLVIELDAYDIEVEDAISALGGTTLLEQCLATGAPVFCDRIERAPNGEITQISSPLQNIAGETARGLDLSLGYGRQLDSGYLDQQLAISYVDERDRIAFPGADPFVGAGEFDQDVLGAIPQYRGNYRVDFDTGKVEWGYSAQWIGSLSERGGEVTRGTTRKIPSRVYHDLRATMRTESFGQWTLGVDNALDEDPPFFANADEANTDVATYRLLGRSYWLRWEQRW